MATQNPTFPVLRFDLVASFAAFTLAMCVMLAMQSGEAFYDFNLHYFSGLQERVGSYTDLNAMFALTVKHGQARPSEGVYGTPSLVALIFQPLSFLSLHAAHTVWNIACSAALVVSIRKAARSPWWIGWFAVVVLSPAMEVALQIGNMSVLTFCLLAYCFGACRDGQYRLAGILLGIAITFKLYPAFLLLAFVFTRRWSVVRWSLSTVAVLCLVTVPALGIHDVMPALRSTSHLVGLVHSGADNVGVPGFALHHHVSSLTASLINYTATAIAIGLIAWNRRLPIAYLFALTATAMLMSQSISWYHYFPLMVLGLISIKRAQVSLPSLIIAWTGFLLATGYVRYLNLFRGPGAQVGETLYTFYSLGGAVMVGILVLVARTRVLNSSDD